MTRTWTVEAVLAEILSVDLGYISHVCIHPPNGEHNPGDRWLAAGLSGGTPVRGYGATLAAAVADLEAQA